MTFSNNYPEEWREVIENRKYKYPPKGMNDAVQTVIIQCKLWANNNIE